jgi:hypothetical protein
VKVNEARWTDNGQALEPGLAEFALSLEDELRQRIVTREPEAQAAEAKPTGGEGDAAKEEKQGEAPPPTQPADATTTGVSRCLGGKLPVIPRCSFSTRLAGGSSGVGPDPRRGVCARTCGRPRTG